eukprot:811893-Prorocentrum_minimum.AAC.2
MHMFSGARAPFPKKSVAKNEIRQPKTRSFSCEFALLRGIRPIQLSNTSSTVRGNTSDAVLVKAVQLNVSQSVARACRAESHSNHQLPLSTRHSD